MGELTLTVSDIPQWLARDPEIGSEINSEYGDRLSGTWTIELEGDVHIKTVIETLLGHSAALTAERDEALAQAERLASALKELEVEITEAWYGRRDEGLEPDWATLGQLCQQARRVMATDASEAERAGTEGRDA